MQLTRRAFSALVPFLPAAAMCADTPACRGLPEESECVHPERLPRIPLGERPHIASPAPPARMEPLAGWEPHERRPNWARGFDAPGHFALTFDDGPDPERTPPLVDYLVKHGIPATFFMIACRAQRHASLVRDMRSAGMLIGNHSWKHCDYGQLTAQEVQEDVKVSHHVLSDIIGEPVRVFRPPLGNDSATPGALREALHTHGYRMSCYWDTYPPDWEAERTAEELIGAIRTDMDTWDRGRRYGHWTSANGLYNFDQLWVLMHDAYGPPGRIVDVVRWVVEQGSQLNLRPALVARDGASNRKKKAGN